MKKIASYLPVILVVLGFGIYFLTKPHAYYGSPVDPLLPAPNFSLTAASGPVSLSDYHGKLVLLFFGYTSCPDECPTTLANFKLALEKLGSQAANVQMIMVTVDPERDTAPKLASWVGNFNPTFLGLTGSKAQIDQVTALYGVTYKKVAGTTPENYSMEHTLNTFVIDRQGQLVLEIPYANTPAQVADDLAYLLK